MFSLNVKWKKLAPIPVYNCQALSKAQASFIIKKWTKDKVHFAPTW